MKPEEKWTVTRYDATKGVWRTVGRGDEKAMRELYYDTEPAEGDKVQLLTEKGKIAGKKTRVR